MLLRFLPHACYSEYKDMGLYVRVFLKKIEV